MRLQLRRNPHFAMVRYTTVSQPECVDGWLGVQLSDKLWFPCWSSKDVTESAAKIAPLIASQERATAALQPANPAASSSSPSVHAVQALQALPRNAATPPPPALPHDSSSANRPLSFAAAQSTPAVDVALSDKVICSLQAVLEKLEAPSADTVRLYGIVNALLSGQQAIQDRQAAIQERHEAAIQRLQDRQDAMHERHQAAVHKLQESLLSNQRLLQEALVASQQQATAYQANNRALTVAACCLSAALLGGLLARVRL